MVEQDPIVDQDRIVDQGLTDGRPIRWSTSLTVELREEAEMTGGQDQRKDQNGDGSLIGQASVWISLKLQSF
jgi:hypothetical protein